MNQSWMMTDAPLGPLPEARNFELVETPMPKPAANQMLTRKIYISHDPYQWWYKLNGSEARGAPCHARTISHVLESRWDAYKPGDIVFNTNGWTRFGLT
ncbi:MAG: NADP-dependent oxidoreductase, partial [Hyphomonadaceae bacterium]